MIYVSVLICSVLNVVHQIKQYVKRNTVLTFRNARFLKHIFQGVMNFLERGALVGVPLPALPHQLVDLRRTTGGRFHPVALLQHVVDVGQVDARVRRHAVRGYFPQQDTEGPDIRLRRELVVGETLGRRPLDRELGPGVGGVGVVPHQPGQPEIGHLHQVVLAHEAVPGGEVPVDEALVLQVTHAAGDLRGDVHQNDGVDLVLATIPEVVQEVAFAHELGYYVKRRFARAHPHELHEVRVLHLFHDGRLFEEILQGHGVFFQCLHSHRHVVALPNRLVHVSVLPPAQFVPHDYVRPVDLPFVWLGAEREHRRLVVLRCGVEQLRDETVREEGMVVHELRQRVEFALLSNVHLALGVLVDSVVIDAAVIPQGYAPLAGAAFGLAHQKAAVDARAEEVLGGVPGYRTVVPGMFLQGVDGRDVVGWHPSDLVRRGVSFTPFSALVVTEYSDLFTCIYKHCLRRM